MSKLSRSELKTSLALSSVVGLRMFGLFLILPVFAAYAARLPGATPVLVGLAIGIYGFGQMLLQVPMGWLSDRIGRRPTISFGLLVFALGSVVAALAHGLGGIIIGRAMQGMGAVSGASQALAADHSSDDNRSKVMAIIGIGIGLAFVLAMILSAPVAAVSGLPGLFGLTAILALSAIALLWWLVPAPPRHNDRAAHWKEILRMLISPHLLVLNGSVFFMHGLMTACFVAMPMLLIRDAHIALDRQWIMYLPVMLASALVMGALLRRVQGLAASMRLILGCALILALSLLAFAGGGSAAWLVWAGALLFFSAFNLLEATLPSMVSRLAPARLRGAAMGAYATCQFGGAGFGGLLGGFGVEYLGLSGLFVGAAVVGLIWLLALLRGQHLVLAKEPPESEHPHA
ncbi:MAG TPA: MFS transporter [Rudaea sp.]|nr:MFS transporter [Rudaea sp.]